MQKISDDKEAYELLKKSAEKAKAHYSMDDVPDEPDRYSVLEYYGMIVGVCVIAVLLGFLLSPLVSYLIEPEQYSKWAFIGVLVGVILFVLGRSFLSSYIVAGLLFCAGAVFSSLAVTMCIAFGGVRLLLISTIVLALFVLFAFGCMFLAPDNFMEFDYSAVLHEAFAIIAAVGVGGPLFGLEVVMWILGISLLVLTVQEVLLANDDAYVLRNVICNGAREALYIGGAFAAIATIAMSFAMS